MDAGTQREGAIARWIKRYSSFNYKGYLCHTGFKVYNRGLQMQMTQPRIMCYGVVDGHEVLYQKDWTKISDEEIKVEYAIAVKRDKRIKEIVERSRLQ